METRKNRHRGFGDSIAGLRRLRHILPEPMKAVFRRFISFDVFARRCREEAELAAGDIEQVSSYPPRYDTTLGVLKEFTGHHVPYVLACRELGVPYQVIDICGCDWLDRIRASGCHGFLVRPTMYVSVWRQMFDERLKVIADDLGKPIYPTYDEIWVYENKRRVYYWLQAHDVPHARTRVYYSMDEALDFARVAPLPIVLKSNLGAASSGVQVFRDHRSLERILVRLFRKGLVRRGGAPLDREWGSVILQEFIPDAGEWRMIRIGDSYFGYEKLRVGDFHSGSHAWRYGRPPAELLDFVRDLTTRHGITSMSLDILVSRDGKPYVSELQTVFGMGHPYEMCVVDEKPGRMVYDEGDKAWRFEAGSFCQNYLCNQRVEYFLRVLGAKQV